MKKFAVLAMAAVTATMAAVAPAAAGQTGRDRTAQVAAGIAGFAVGAIVGNALSDDRRVAVNHQTSRHSGRHYRNDDRRHPRRQATYRTWGEPWSPEWFQWCRANYRSFNPQTGTWRGYDGKVRFCEVPRAAR